MDNHIGQPNPALPSSEHELEPTSKYLIERLDRTSRIWLAVTVVFLFFVGVGWLCGPAAWIKGNSLRTQYEELDTPPSGAATAIWIIGITTSVLLAGGIVVIAIAFLVAGIALLAL